MEEWTPLSQEVRNLYTFYFPDSPLKPKMDKRIIEYNQLVEERLKKMEFLSR
jgi:hypothetical protein